MTALKDLRQPPKDDPEGEPGPIARRMEGFARKQKFRPGFYPPLPPPPSLADAIGAAIARHESTIVAELRRDLTASKAEPEATPPPARSGQAYAPKRAATKTRAEWMERILAALRELDTDLDTDAMPGRKVDFQEMCKALAPRPFTVTPDVFKDTALKGRARFLSRARETTYYRDRLEAVRRKLG